MDPPVCSSTLGMEGGGWAGRAVIEREEGPEMQVTTLGLDIAKQVFYVVGTDSRGRQVVRK